MAGEAAEAADVDWDALGRSYPLKYDFAFAWDTESFSDRILRLEIISGDEFVGAFHLPRKRHRFYHRVVRSEATASGNLGGGLAHQGADHADLDQGTGTIQEQEQGQYKQGNNLETCKASVGGVNGSSTCGGTLANLTTTAVTGLNASLSCGSVISAKSFSSIADLPPHQEVGMPSLYPTMTVGIIAKWVKKEGDKVSPGEVLCEVETDNGRLDMECVEEGYLAKIVQGDGAQEIKVDEIICVTVKEGADTEKFENYKPSSSDINNIPPSSVKGTGPESAYCHIQKAAIEDHLGETSQSTTAPQAKRVKDVRINSAVLAAHSSTFRKIFSVGMKETSQKVLKYVISEQEEAVMMEVIGFLYNGQLSTTEPCLLLDISSVADCLGVFPLIEHTIRLLTSLPITTESALLYLDYPFTDAVAEEVHYLTGLAKQFILNKYKYLNKIPEDFWDIPLVGIEIIFGSSEIYVDSEDVVYEILIKWAHRHYPVPEERHSIWSSRLLSLVRFRHMSRLKLQEISGADSDGLHGEETWQCIAGALVNCKSTSGKVSQRQYTHKHISVVEFDQSSPQQVIVYFNLTRAECSRLFPNGQVCSHLFSFSGRKLYLLASCERNTETNFDYFGFWVGKLGQDGGDLTVNVEFASKARATGRYVTRLDIRNAVLDGTDLLGGMDLFDPWLVFIDDNDHFINDVLRLRVDLSLVE